jgi:beta-phosphoglucomutase-like phosphatase (HAD superfamily)
MNDMIGGGAAEAGVEIRAVLFDMDGTLVSSDAAVERAWTTWAGEHGVAPADAIAVQHGSPSEPTVRKLLPHLDDAAVAVSAARQLELQYDDLSDVAARPRRRPADQHAGRPRRAVPAGAGRQPIMVR